MGELKISDVIKGILYNKDGTVEYVFDDAKLEEVIAPFVDNESNSNETLLWSSSKDCEISFESATINENALYWLGAVRWYNWWNKDKVEYYF